MRPQPPPSATPVPPSTPPASAPAPHRRTGSVIAALLFGLVLGGGGVGAAWALNDERDSPAAGAGPAGDARAACQALDGFDESKYVAKGPDGDVAINRYAAAGALSASAAAGDATYKPLAQAIRRSQDLHAQVFGFNEEVKSHLREARRICEGL
ncbi:hypothetical protein [Streptomyces sp. CB03238]|uniref:hypothetical protein n=1 Tax=Streptomyces sp. CB03238 TaxID=1907777 RepID=UPI001F4EA576|nr:hypothetical protein [Streptomyces sp. CB03238]